MFWLIGIGVAIVALIVIAAVAGLMLPETSHATVTMKLDRPAGEVYRALMDGRRYPVSAGSARVQRVEPLAETPQGPAWREVLGSTTVQVRTLEAEPSRRVVRELSDPAVPMTARWEISLEPLADGTRVTLHEATTVGTGTWRAPFFRVIMRLVGGAGGRGYLKTLER